MFYPKVTLSRSTKAPHRPALSISLVTGERWSHGPEHPGHHLLRIRLVTLHGGWPPVYKYSGWVCTDCP